MSAFLIPDVGDVLVLGVVTSIKRMASSLVTEYPVESRASKTDFVVPQAGALELSGVFGPAELEAGIVDRLESYRARVLIANTELGVLSPCVLKDVDVSRTPEDGTGAKWSISIKQILVAEAKVIQRPPGVKKTSPPKEKGRQKAAPADAQTDDAYNSILSRITGAGVSF